MRSATITSATLVGDVALAIGGHCPGRVAGLAGVARAYRGKGVALRQLSSHMARGAVVKNAPGGAAQPEPSVGLRQSVGLAQQMCRA